jgi:nicotinate phosphoribosyltransferase
LRNLTLLTDFYELTMMLGYLHSGMADRKVVFDLFFRKSPSGNGYAIAAGLEQAVEYIENLHFPDEELEYLSSTGSFDREFIQALENFEFTGDIYAMPEGTVVFPHEPLIRVEAPLFQAQLVETALLTIVNHQSLIATKAARVSLAAQGTVLEFGLRRAQGPDAGIYGARAAIIGGCQATSNVLAGRMFGVPVRGTHAHSWVMSFDTELEAFREYAKRYPKACILLVDTYDTLKSGVPNAIKIFSEMKENGIPLTNYGIRLDSGDLAYLSKMARRMLDKAGFEAAVISASSDLDENIISQLKLQGAQITVWGVGTNLITSQDCPSFGGVYKLAEEESPDGVRVPKIKLSENPEKVTNPGKKKVLRFYGQDTGKIRADVICLDDETFDPSLDVTIFDPDATWKQSTLEAGTYTIRDLLEPVFINGEKVISLPSVMEIQAYCQKELDTLWDEHKRLSNPQICYVDLSEKLYNLKQSMIRKTRISKH